MESLVLVFGTLFFQGPKPSKKASKTFQKGLQDHLQDPPKSGKRNLSNQEFEALGKASARGKKNRRDSKTQSDPKNSVRNLSHSLPEGRSLFCKTKNHKQDPGPWSDISAWKNPEHTKNNIVVYIIVKIKQHTQKT